MPSALIHIVRRRPACAALGLALVAAAGLLPWLPGCETGGRAGGLHAASRVYPPDPQPPRVIALGAVRGAPPPSQTEVQLSYILFGAEPPARLALANPAGLAPVDGGLLICDTVLGALLRWDAASDRLTEERVVPPPDRPFAVDVFPDGSRLLCDQGGARRVTAAGDTLRHYTLDGRPFRVGGGAVFDGRVWLTNATAHTIEVFAADSGAHERTIGRHGRELGEFSYPRSVARGPDGTLCVVDALNSRLQLVAPDGRTLRSIGQQGDSVGDLGRPRDVVVGPDGTIFVTDAFSQRVQVFAADGRVLLAFGEPGTGVGALALPAGIAIVPSVPPTEHPLPAGVQPRYYVIVAEALDRPGLRVYAWLGYTPDDLERLRAETAWAAYGPGVGGRATFPGSEAINPHWSPERCNSCHTMVGDRAEPIPPGRVDALCLTCHDGNKAPADPHPIGRPKMTDVIATPADWPTHNDLIGCLTCHDIARHCSPQARRPALNPMLLRSYDPQRALEYCTICHSTDLGGRFSPHRQRDAAGRIRQDACLFCHTRAPEVPADGRRQFRPYLRSESSDICLNCHSPHWDLSRQGHVDRPVTPRIRQWMVMRDLRLKHPDATREELARLAAQAGQEPARVPLGQDRVTCYSCHNPHYAGLFPEGSELGALARNPQDRRSALRTDWIDLCSECHHH